MQSSKPETIDITVEDRAAILAILAKYVPDCEVWAFGSRVTGGATRHSDLDLAVKCRGKLPLELLGSIKYELAESSVPIRVDVLDWHRISEEFKKIVEEQKVIFKPANTQ
jgi:predicted nucleotidyltransferase